MNFNIAELNKLPRGRQISYAFIFVLGSGVWALLTQFLFIAVLHLQTQSVKEAIGAEIRHFSGDDENELSRILSEPTHAGLTRCIKLTRADGTVILDSTFQGPCYYPALSLEGRNTSVRAATINGQEWSVNFLVLPPPGFGLILWITRLSGVLISALFVFALFQREQYALNALELERKRVNQVRQIARQVGHDLRSPLGAMKMALSKLNSGNLEAVQLGGRSVVRMETIVEDLLKEYSVTESLRDLRFEIRPDELVDQIVSEKRALFENVQWSLNCPSRPLCVSIRPEDLRRTVSNLVQNSLEATSGAKPARLSIRAEIVGAVLKFEFTDNGPGFPSPVLSAFEEKKIVSHGKVDGHGLGLNSARETVENAGGKMAVANLDPNGAKVTISIPCAE